MQEANPTLRCISTDGVNSRRVQQGLRSVHRSHHRLRGVERGGGGRGARGWYLGEGAKKGVKEWEAAD